MVISPGAEDDPISCYVYRFPAGKEPKYRALSYVWGDQLDQVDQWPKISLNTSAFPVTPNLYKAIRSLRQDIMAKPDPHPWLWIDAICIDQANTPERNEQVRRMPSLYANAEHVLIWLGDYSEGGDVTSPSDFENWGVDHFEEGSKELTSSALEIAKALALHWKLEGRGEHGHYIQEADRTLDAFFATNTGRDVHAWYQLRRIFKRPWFHRLWVVQELWASKCSKNGVQNAVVRCGRVEFDWNTLLGAARCLHNRQLRNCPRLGTLSHPFIMMGSSRVLNMEIPAAGKTGIWVALRRTQEAACSNPLDRLNGILGLLQDSQDRGDIRVDYSSTVEVAYREWALRRIHRTRSLDVFSACTDLSRFEGGSSWVPELRSRWGTDSHLLAMTHVSYKSLNRTGFFLELGKITSRSFVPIRVDANDEHSPGKWTPWNAASGISGFEAIISENPHTLSMNGIRICRIDLLSQISNLEPKKEDMSDLSELLYATGTEWEAFAQEYLKPPLDVVFYESVAFTTYADVLSRGYAPRESVELSAKNTEHYVAWRASKTVSSDQGSGNLERSAARPFLTSFEALLAGLV